MPASTLDDITSPGRDDDAGDALVDPAAAVHAAVSLMSSYDLGRCDFAQLDRLANAAQRVRGFLVSFDTRLAARRHQLAHEPFEGPGTSGSDTSGDGGDTPGDDHGPSGSDDGTGDGAGGTGEGDQPSGSGAGAEADPTLEFGGPTAPRPDADHDRDRSRAITLALFPQFRRSLELGEIDPAHVDALTAALARFDLRNLDEADAHRAFIAHEATLVVAARSEKPPRFRRRCLELTLRLARDRGLRLAERQRKAAELRSWVDRSTGMGHISATLEPELFEKVMTAIELQLASLKKLAGSADVGNQRLRVEAFAELICSSGELASRSAEIVVLCDEATLRTGLVEAGSVCETSDGAPLHPETLRRLACDARLIPVVLDGDGLPIDVGRARYEPTSAQRRALAAMYRTCAHPECDVPFRRCRIHHVLFWEHLGRTDLANLVPLCERHHHLVHEGGWTLAMSPDRVISLTSPSGVLSFVGDTRDRPPLVTADPPPEQLGPERGTAERVGADATCRSNGSTGRSAAAAGPAPVTKRRRRQTGPSQSGNPTLFHDDRQAAAP